MHTYVHTHRSTPSWPATCELLSSLPSLPQLKQIATLKAHSEGGACQAGLTVPTPHCWFSAAAKFQVYSPVLWARPIHIHLPSCLTSKQILKSWGYQCIYITTIPVATAAGKRSMNLSRAIKRYVDKYARMDFSQYSSSVHCLVSVQIHVNFTLCNISAKVWGGRQKHNSSHDQASCKLVLNYLGSMGIHNFTTKVSFSTTIIRLSQCTTVITTMQSESLSAIHE